MELNAPISKTAAAFIAAVLLVLSAMLASSCPTVALGADYDELSELMSQAEEMKASIEASKNDYIVAIQQSEQLAAQKKEAEVQLHKVEKRLENERTKLNRIAIASYKHENDYLGAIMSAGDFNSFTSQVDCYRRIAEERSQVVEEVAKLERELSEIPPKLAEQERLAKESAAVAEMNKAAFEKELESLKPRIKEMKAAFSDALKSKQGSAQLDEILEYLDSIGEVTDTQIAIVQSAYRTPYAGGNMCEAWAEMVYRNAGIDVPRLMCAYDGWVAYGMGENTDNIPIGSYVYGSGTSVPYSHVGILVADGMVLDNEAAAGGHTAVPLEEWITWQTAVSSNNGKSGWFGWGHPDWLDFSDGEPEE